LIALPIPMIRPANPDDSYFGGVSHPPYPPSSFAPVRLLNRVNSILKYRNDISVTEASRSKLG
jgi:hypothetical protein